MTKNRFLLTILSILLLSSCGANPVNEKEDPIEPEIIDIPDDEEEDPIDDDPPEEEVKETYNDIYTLNKGYTKEDVQGGPIWMNTNIKGDVNKITKPKLTDDFYTNINYEGFINESDSFFDVADKTTVANLYELTTSKDEDIKNKDILSSAASKIYEGEKETVHNKIQNLMDNGIYDFLLSKEAIEMNSGPFHITFDSENNSYHLGYHTDVKEIQYRGASYYTYYINYYTWIYEYYGDSYIAYKQYAEQCENTLRKALKELYIGAGFTDENVYDSYIDLGLQGETKVFNAMKRNFSNNNPYRYTLNNLTQFGAYLSKYFDVNSDLLTTLNGTGLYFYTQRYELDALNYIYNHFEDDAVKALLINRLLFEYRFMLGYEGYKEAGTILAKESMTNDFRYKDETDIKSITMKQMYGLLHDAVDNSYINKYIDDKRINKVKELISDIRSNYIDMLNANDWLSNTTKAKAIEKLENMKAYVGYPTSLKTDYLEITKSEYDSLFDVYEEYISNKLLMSINQIELDFEAFTGMTMLTVNAYNSFGNNSIVILQGIIEGVEFDDKSNENLLATLGVIVGHEISHSFDINGAQYDKDGNYNNWWTLKDKEAFTQRAEKITNYFNQVEALKGVFCNGQNNNGEASSDMGGVKVALYIAKSIPNFNYDTFFKDYAKMWLRVTEIERMKERIEDSHPLEYLRVNVTLSQFDEFIETYDLKPGDKMYVAKEDRIAIW